MEINLKDTLKSLRHKKNVTQEALAEYLGITQQSVGKWERGEGFPDITLLPKIALYFNISIDDLLNVGQARIDEEIAEYDEQGRRYAREGDILAEIDIYERAYAEFPNNHKVMHDLMCALFNKPTYPPKQETSDRIIELGTRILEESNNNYFREGAVQALCLTYNAIKDTENAMKYAKMGGSVYVTQDELQAKVAKGEEGLIACQEYIMNLVHLTAMAATASMEKVLRTRGEQIAAHQFAVNQYLMLFSDGNVGFYAGELSWNYAQMAMIYAQTKSINQTLEALKKCVEYAVMTADKTPKPYTAPLVDRLTYEPAKTVKNYKGNSCNTRLKEFEWSCFDFVRESDEFKELTETLKKYAETV